MGGVAAQGGYPRLEARAFAPDGTLRWEWRDVFGWYPKGDAHGMEIGPDGSVYLYGADDRFVSHGQQVIAIDSSGTFRWDRKLLVSGAARAVAFDSQGQVVVLGPGPYGYMVHKIRSDGTIAFSAHHPGHNYTARGNCIAVDGFDRISVGGSRVPPGSNVREAALFRLDPGGVLIGVSIPSVPGVGQEGSFEQLHVTARNDVVAFGSSTSGTQNAILARFGHDGTERWSIGQRGGPPPYSGLPGVKLGLAADPRGNLFTLAQTRLGGSYPNRALELDLARHVQNGPLSDSFCGP